MFRNFVSCFLLAVMCIMPVADCFAYQTRTRTVEVTKVSQGNNFYQSYGKGKARGIGVRFSFIRGRQPSRSVQAVQVCDGNTCRIEYQAVGNQVENQPVLLPIPMEDTKVEASCGPDKVAQPVQAESSCGTDKVSSVKSDDVPWDDTVTPDSPEATCGSDGFSTGPIRSFLSRGNQSAQATTIYGTRRGERRHSRREDRRERRHSSDRVGLFR